MPGMDGAWTFEGLCQDSLRVVDQIFEKCYAEDTNNWRPRVIDQLSSLVLSAENWEKIPLYNSMEPHLLKNNQLVRFRGFVQDTHDTELFVGLYDVKHRKTGVVGKRTGLFRDYFSSGNCEEVVALRDCEVPRSLMERQSFYCISVPGENDWVTKALGDTGYENRDEVSSGRNECDQDQEMDFCASGDSKKQASVSNQNSKAVSTDCAKLLNFPLPNMIDRGAKAVTIKTYNDASESAFLLNEVYEFTGLLCMEDPVSVLANRSEDAEPMVTSEEDTEPTPLPLSLVPRMYMIASKKVDYDCAFLKLPELNSDERCSAREELKELLTDCMMGDDLAAEYLLLHFTTKVRLRGHAPVNNGNISLNLLFGQEPNDACKAFLLEIIQSLLPKSSTLDLTVANLNTMAFVPAKDYDENRLKSSVLQLAEGTHMVVDETKMEAGTLNELGLCNLEEIKEVLQRQILKIEFGFHKMDVNVDIPCLVLSEGASLLGCDVVLPVIPLHRPSSVEAGQARSRANARLADEAFMNRMRSLIVMARERPGEKWTQDVHDALLNDFGQENDSRPKEDKLSAEQFSMLITYARQRSMTYGRDTLDLTHWKTLLEMDTTRKKRLSDIRRQRSATHPTPPAM